MNVKIIGEIGINHNGRLDLAKRLIDVAVDAGCDFVKFQKRDPDVCVPEHQKVKIRKGTPWGDVPYIDYKHKVEFWDVEYDEINAYCKSKDIGWFASVWDVGSVDFMSNYTSIGKIPSALITDIELLSYSRKKFDTLIMSTGMSTQAEINTAVEIAQPDVIMHSVSSYPSDTNELNLLYVKYLYDHFSETEIGYSGHELELETTAATVLYGASWIERHITLDRNMWGSDHKCSLEPTELSKLVDMIHNIKSSMGSYGPRKLMGSEKLKKKSLRKR